MFHDVALTGLFATRDSALYAGEKLRELAGPRALVRVLFPGAAASVVEVAVLPATSGTFGVAAGGALFGLVAFAVMMALGSGWTMALVALGWGIAAGAMLAWWLTGTTEPAQTLRGFDAKRCYEMLAGTECAVVVVVAGARRADALREAIAAAGGEPFVGLDPWLTVATRIPRTV